MQEHTRYRLNVLDNGYWPLLNNCKRPIGKDWQRKRPDRAEVLSWDRSAFASTGMKIDGDLAVIDADIREAALIDALAEALDKRYPELFARGLVRHAGGVKEAWFARTEKPFQRIYSRKWCRGNPKDSAAITHHVECFGALGTRQFGVDGPHTRKHGVVIRTYSFAGGASPANTPRELLPVLPKAAFVAACNLFDEIAAAAGLTAIKAETQGNGTTRVVYDLADDMVFESDSDTYRFDELEDALCAAQHEGRELRVTSSFLGHGTNATKCIVGRTKRRRHPCLYIHDFETGLTHMPADCKPAEECLMERLFVLIPDRHKSKGDPSCSSKI
jgi:hypothetical protein